MACRVIIHSWTFCRLVGAFLDLAIAYFLLCCSAIAFFLAKFLSFFGLSLPCPCNGLFGYPNAGPCLQRVLGDYRNETISSLQLSVKSKFPFDSILARNDHCQLNLKLVKERKSDDGILELEGEASYSSFSDPRRSQHSLSRSDSIGKFDIKGKGAAGQRTRCGLRRRRRASVDYGKFTSSSSYDYMRSDVRAIYQSPSDPNKVGNLQNSTPVNTRGMTTLDFESNDATDDSKLIYDNATYFENLKDNVGPEHGVDGEDENAVRILEQALEEEHAARVALCSELEQERVAAATAADEAMAMISRLQEEKASIGIEARQYQRILEEKAAYDAEEMDILKEIIIRRELEKHFLEKEVEAYMNMFQEDNGLEGEVDYTREQNDVPFHNSSVDPMLTLQQLSESIDKQENMQNKSSYPHYAASSVEKQTSCVSLGKELPVLQWENRTKIVKELESAECSSIIPDHSQSGDETNQEIQDKGMLSMDEIPYLQLCKSSSSQGPKDDVCHLRNAVHDVVKSDDGEQMLMIVGEPHVNDLHIIDSKCDICKKTNGKGSDPVLMHNNTSNIATKCGLPFGVPAFQRIDGTANDSLKVELDINRSCSDVVDRLPTVRSSPNRSLVSELQHNSLSAVDRERLKIDSEIGRLRARLRAVQGEKEKLNSSLERQETGKTELQLLEDIATQLREIRYLTGPEKAVRQASLPPLSSKDTSKKRRSRSISVGVSRSESS